MSIRSKASEKASESGERGDVKFYTTVRSKSQLHAPARVIARHVSLVDKAP